MVLKTTPLPFVSIYPTGPPGTRVSLIMVTVTGILRGACRRVNGFLADPSGLHARCPHHARRPQDARSRAGAADLDLLMMLPLGILNVW